MSTLPSTGPACPPSAADDTQQRLDELRGRIRARTASAADFIVYNLLRGKPASAGFTTPTNPRRLAHGQGPFDGFLRASELALWNAHLVPFELVQMLDESQLSVLRQERVRLVCETFRRAQVARLPRGNLLGLLRRAMKTTPQGASSVYAHCRQTEKCAAGLVRARRYGSSPERRARMVPAWLPAWYFESPHLDLSPPDCALLQAYLLMHDCGKPFVYLEDEAQKAHFPEHAAMSARVWGELGGSEAEQYLMTHDMDLHTLRADQLEAFSRGRFARVQLVAALASLWANQQDLGGESSTSFKMKLKHLDRRGRALCRLWAADAAKDDAAKEAAANAKSH